MLNPHDHEADAAAPIDMLEAYYAAHGWEHERHEDEIIATAKGSWTSYELRGLWREHDSVLQFLAFPDIKVPDDRRAQIYETMALVNEQLWIGHFELWSSTNVLLFRHAAMIDGDADGNGEGTMSLAAAELLVESAIDECERFYPVFQFVLWGGKSPRDALAAALVETQGSVTLNDAAGRLLLVGCGHMAGAMLKRWLAAGLDPALVTAVSPSGRAMPAGVRVVGAIPDELFDTILLGLKPQQLGGVRDTLRAHRPRLLVSILAGVELATLAGMTDAGVVVRAMPNLPVAIGKGVVALHGPHDAAADVLMAPLGLVEWIGDEALFDVVTALAGSGPGFLYRYIDAMAAAGTALGLPADQAARLALATVEGSALLAAAADVGPAELAERVASPRGSTREGLNVLDRDGALVRLLTDTLRAAAVRNAAMAAEVRTLSL